MASEPPLWLRLLMRCRAYRASDAAIGDLLEEYAGGDRSPLWLLRQIVSTLRVPGSSATSHRGRVGMLSNVAGDIRYALRTFRRHPGFAAAAIAPIALGIGLNTGVFSIVGNVLLRAVPAAAPTELVSIHQDFRGVQGRRVHGARSMFSVPEYRAYREGARTLSGVLGYTKAWTATLGGRSPTEIEGSLVTCSYFEVLGVRPSIGTGFTAANCETPGTPPAVVLSHALWTRAFDADPGIVRQTITLNGQAVAVVGVAPEGFDGIDFTRAAFFASTSLQQEFHDHAKLSWLTLVGRRHPGVALAEVRAELAVIAGRIDRQEPGRVTTLIVEPATSLSLPVARRDFLSYAAIVLAAFGLVLLIACANVANVLLARAAGRTKEIAVRLSLGASRGRLIQQLLTESLIIATAGGAAGALLAWWSFQLLLAWLLSHLPATTSQPRIDANPSLPALWCALGLTAITALVVGLVPALHASKQDVQTVMKQDGVDLAGRGGGWIRGSFITVQIAVCMVLLCSAGLLLRTLYAAQTIDPGFDHRQVAVVAVDLRGPAYDGLKAGILQRELVDRIGALPGVDAVTQVGRVPLSPGRTQTNFRLPDQQDWHDVDFNSVSPAFFSTIGIPIVSGRTFAPAELEGTPRVVIVTDATARRLWPGQDPIDRTILLGSKQPVTLTVIGVARDAHVSHAAEATSRYIYLPTDQTSSRAFRLLVKSHTDDAALATSVVTLTRGLDPGLLARVHPLEKNLEDWRSGSRAVATLSVALGLLALLLASVGVYGVVSYVATRRRREVGIRMTLGATARSVRGLILRQMLRPVAVGVVIGMVGAAASSHLLEGMLFGVSPLDPAAFIGAAAFLFIVATAASLLPTRQALTADPMTTLRRD